MVYYQKWKNELIDYQMIVYTISTRRHAYESKIISSEQEVKDFLKELKELLTGPRFDNSKDLDILLKKKHESPIDPYTTANTILELEFDKSDVANQLLSLDITEYLETFIDDKGIVSTL